MCNSSTLTGQGAVVHGVQPAQTQFCLCTFQHRLQQQLCFAPQATLGSGSRVFQLLDELCNVCKLLSGHSQLQRARGQLRNHVGVNRLRLGVLPLQNLTSCGTVCVCNVAQALHLLLHLLLH